jgi:hypothetical protein
MMPYWNDKRGDQSQLFSSPGKWMLGAAGCSLGSLLCEMRGGIRFWRKRIGTDLHISTTMIPGLEVQVVPAAPLNPSAVDNVLGYIRGLEHCPRCSRLGTTRST